MADALDMSLDDLISKSRSTHQRPVGEARPPEAEAQAPHTRRRDATSTAALPQHLTSAAQPSFSRAIQPQPSMVSAIDEPTKLYISNLDYGVSNDDIKESLFFSCHKPCCNMLILPCLTDQELFSDVGDIKRYSINYDRSGGSKGTAEVIFSRRSDALAAVKRYNNVQLDGKPMKIEIIGTNIEAPPPPTAIFSFNPPAGNFNLPFKSWPGRGGAGGWPQSRGGFGGRGHGRGRGRGKGEGRGEKVSAEDLDAGLDKYHAAAMETS